METARAVRTMPWIWEERSSELAVATAAVAAVRRKMAVVRLAGKLKGFGAISCEGFIAELHYTLSITRQPKWINPPMITFNL